jgi:hypothetical protein
MLIQKHIQVLSVRMPWKVQAKPVQMTVEGALDAALARGIRICGLVPSGCGKLQASPGTRIPRRPWR